MNKPKPWQKVARIAEIRTKWVRVYADTLRDDAGAELEYWHVVRPDSVIVIVRQGGKFILPDRQYRPGVEAFTLDFAGGRINEGEEPQAAALRIVKKELGIGMPPPGLRTVCEYPLDVDSSFSNQMLWGFFVELPEGMTLASGALRLTINELMSELHCLQCRALFLEWQIKR